MKIVVDSYAWVELFSGSVKGGDVKKKLQEAEQVITPDVVLAELARKYMREDIEEEAVRERLAMVGEVSEVVGISGELALEAARAFLELQNYSKQRRVTRPSLFDAIVLATARTQGAKVLTGDQHFKSLKETIWLGP